MDMFSIFSQSRYSFEGQLRDEHTALVLRADQFFLIGIIIGAGIFAILPFVLYIFIGRFLIDTNLTSVYWFIVALYLLIVWSGFFYRLIIYYLNVWIITDHRIIANEQQGFFRRSVAELNIVKVQDVEVKINGFIATFLDFGDLQIQSAGTEEKFLFKKIPNPNRAKDLIIELQRDFLGNHPDGREPSGL